MKKGRFFVITALLLCTSFLFVLFTGCGQSQKTVKIAYETGADATNLSPNTAKAGSKIYPPADPEREGYRFGGWELDGAPYTFDVMPDEDITLTAVWNKLYTLSFETGADGIQVPSAQYIEGEEIAYPEPPARAHYRFNGWMQDGVSFLADKMPAQDVTLTADWLEVVTITFVTDLEGVSVDPISDVAGAEISAPKVKTEGFYLRGWKTASGEPYELNVMPEEDITLFAEWIPLTNLPAMFIDLFDESGALCPLETVNQNKDSGRDVYTTSRITLTNTDADSEIDDALSGFKGRGNGSWWDIPYPKKGYKIKFDKKQSLFGRAANKHWCIIACVSSQFQETTMSRNYLAYNMADEVFDHLEYTTNAVWIDVYINGEYHGVYLLCEHVRVGEGRVDIESDYLNGTQDPASTGYLIEYDSYGANNTKENEDYFRIEGARYPFTLHSPDPEDDAYRTEGGISLAEFQRQIAYIKDYVQRTYTAALTEDFATFSALADVDSFVDMYILHELFKNVDTGFSSFYLYKKPNGKLYAGPAWDFDGTCNATRGDQSPQGIYVADSVQRTSPDTASELYIALYKQSDFKSAIRARWKVLSPKISAFLDEKLNDEVYRTYKAAMGKNYAKWLGTPQLQAEGQWVIDVRDLKDWLVKRIAWLDGEWK